MSRPNLLQLIGQDVPQSESDAQSTIFFVGNKNAGKSTMINVFLKDTKQPEPTAALNYVSVRVKETTTHIWELGGGTSLIDLIDTVLTPATIATATVCIALDLSQPADVLSTCTVFLQRIARRTEEVLRELSSLQSPVPEQLRKQAFAQFPDSKPEPEVRPSLVPIVILATKYDTFRDREQEYRKLMARTLRWLAATNGAYLFYTTSSDGEEKLASKYRNALANIALREAPSRRAVANDNAKPLFIPAGADSLDKIGGPTGGTGTRATADEWRRTFTSYFASQPTAADKVMSLFDTDQYKEESIDALRAQKDEELERYRAQTEKSSLAKIMNS